MAKAKERKQGKDETDFMKKKLADQLEVANIESKFATTYDAVEQEIKVGEKVDKMNLDWLLWDPKIRCKLLLGKKSTQKVIVMGQTDRQMVSKKDKSKIWPFRHYIQGVQLDFLFLF